MRWTLFRTAGLALALAGILLLPGATLAGGRALSNPAASSRSPAPHAVPVVVRYTPQQTTVSVVVVAPSQPASNPTAVNLRGPDGKVRRFAVEGGREAIQPVRAYVLRAGQSITVRLATAK